MADIIPVYVGDELQLRKPHACGGNHWLVLRTGAEVRLECAQCGRKLAVGRAALERQIRRFLARGPRAAAEAARRQSPPAQQGAPEAGRPPGPAGGPDPA